LIPPNWRGASLGLGGRLDRLPWAAIPRPGRPRIPLVVFLLVTAVGLARLWQPDLATLFVGAAVALAVYRFTIALTGDPRVRQAVAVGFALRLGLAVAFYLISFHHWPVFEQLQWTPGFWSFAPDSWFWDGTARGLLGLPMDVVDSRLGVALQPTTWPPFTIGVAAIYWLTGDYVLSATLINVGLATLTVALAAALVERLGSPAGARLVAWTLALWPSFLLWSTQLLKDCTVNFLVMLSLYLSLEVVRPLNGQSSWRGRRTAALVGLALTLFGLFLLRDFLALSWLLVLVVLGFVLGVRRLGRLPPRTRWAAVACLALLGGVLLAVEGPCLVDYRDCRTSTVPGQALTGRTIERIAMYRRGATTEHGTHVALGEIAPSNGKEMLFFAPLAVTIGLLAPFPPAWFAEGQSVKAFRILSSFEMLALYLVLPWLVIGSWIAVRRVGLFGTVLIVLAVVYTLIFGIVVVNEGSLFRVRQSALLVILVLAASGLRSGEAA
jgi:hypothetical protein